jgi:hypothetical protein
MQCMLADRRDGGAASTALSLSSQSHSIAHGGRAARQGRAGQAFSLPECRAKATLSLSLLVLLLLPAVRTCIR